MSQVVDSSWFSLIPFLGGGGFLIWLHFHDQRARTRAARVTDSAPDRVVTTRELNEAVATYMMLGEELAHDVRSRTNLADVLRVLEPLIKEWDDNVHSYLESQHVDSGFFGQDNLNDHLKEATQSPAVAVDCDYVATYVDQKVERLRNRMGPIEPALKQSLAIHIAPDERWEKVTVRNESGAPISEVIVTARDAAGRQATDGNIGRSAVIGPNDVSTFAIPEHYREWAAQSPENLLVVFYDSSGTRWVRDGLGELRACS